MPLTQLVIERKLYGESLYTFGKQISIWSNALVK